MISWREWKRWTDDSDEEIQEIKRSLEDLTRSLHVCEFLEYFAEFLEFCRVQEIARHVDDPRREPRTYHEALRDMQAVVNELKPKGKVTNGGRIRIAGRHE